MYLVKLKKQLDLILNIGVHQNLTSKQIESIRIINGFCLIIAFFISIISIVNLMTGFPMKVVYHIFFLSTVHIPIFYFQYKKKYFVAAFYFTACSLIYIYFTALIAYFEARFTETENLIFIHLVFILLIFDGKVRNILYLLSLSSLLILKAIKFYYLGININADYLYTIINILFIAFGLYSFVSLFKRELIESKKIIAVLNDELATQNEEMAMQNEEISSQYDTLKEHEAHIEIGRKILRSTVDNLPMFVAMLDNQGKYIVANQIYGEKFQKTMTEIEGHHYAEVLTEEILQKHHDLIAKGLKGEKNKFEEINHYPNGTQQHSFGEYIPITNHQGLVTFLLVYVTDITFLKAIENKLIELNQSKNKLFSIIAHDLRSPLNTLTGLLELVEDDMVNEQEFKSIVGELSKNVSYTSQLLNNLLHWASNQMERQVIYPQKFDIHSLIEDNIALASKNALQKQITLSYNKANDYQIWADKDMIDLVLRNLISNAIKFTPIGGNIHIIVTTQTDYVSVSVQDNGVGISNQAVNDLFQYQTHSTRGTNGEKGSGLGLILCKEFIEKNGGQIEVTSKLNEGTTFTFTVPCSEAIANRNPSLQL